MKWFKKSYQSEFEAPELWPESYIAKQWKKAMKAGGESEEEFPFAEYLQIAGLAEASVDDAKDFYQRQRDSYDTGHLKEAIIDFAGLQMPRTSEELHDVILPKAKAILGIED